MAEIIVTGGTFDKDYNERTGHVDFSHEKTSVPDMLKIARATGHTVNVAFLIDSLDMYDEEHRVELAQLCRDAESDDIVVTHGTDTMIKSAQFFEKAEIDKTIVLTGAMRPHRLSESDAMFNLAYALASAQHLPSGVYVAIQGQVFSPSNVRKNITFGVFEKIRP